MIVGLMIHVMLGCEWGRVVWTPDDPEPCQTIATRVVCFHNPEHVPGVPEGVDGAEVRLCVWHATRVCEEETTPHASG